METNYDKRMIIEPRWYQSGGVQALFDYFYEGNKGNPIEGWPGGTGKSLGIALFIKKVYELFADQRVMMITHVKELIEQNAEKLKMVWPTAPMGIYSAALDKRDTYHPIIYGGVKSIANEIKRSISMQSLIPPNLRHFGKRQLIVVDECHLIGPEAETEYRFVIEEFRKINPDLKVIGFTATYYRLGQGLLTEGKNRLFTDICYDITDYESYNRLLNEGWLSPLIGVQPGVQMDLGALRLNKGEYNQNDAQSAMDEIIEKAIDETIYWGMHENRKSWLIFTSGIESTEKVAHMLRCRGINAVASHSRVDPDLNTRYINAFKNFQIQALVNNNKYTTGFDHPAIDLLVDLQPTTSAAKHVQKGSRGTRPFSCTFWVKENCRYLGFAGNVENLGPINDPKIPRPPGEKGNGDPPIRICRKEDGGCGWYNHPSKKFCECCGKEFAIKIKITSNASTESPLRLTTPDYKYLSVDKVFYSKHIKKTKEGLQTAPPCLKATYICGLDSYTEYIMIEHNMKGLLYRAKNWWSTRHHTELPATVDEALRLQSELRMPVKIKIDVNSKYKNIEGVEWF